MPDRANDNASAGVALAGASILSVIAMAHHPVGFAHAGLAQLVHGVMIAIVVVLVAGYARLALWIGLERFVVMFALIAYCFGAVANVLAALINGFVVGQVHARGVSEEVLLACWALNQALAYGAVYASSFAFLVWGIALVRKTGLSRLAGAVGVAAATAPPILLLTGMLAMNVSGAFVVYGLQAAFGVVAGAVLIRQRSEANA